MPERVEVTEADGFTVDERHVPDASDANSDSRLAAKDLDRPADRILGTECAWKSPPRS